jgi:hypothetical protein
MEILKSKRENPIDYHDGFVYTQHRVTVEKMVLGSGWLFKEFNIHTYPRSIME